MITIKFDTPKNTQIVFNVVAEKNRQHQVYCCQIPSFQQLCYQGSDEQGFQIDWDTEINALQQILFF